MVLTDSVSPLLSLEDLQENRGAIHRRHVLLSHVSQLIHSGLSTLTKTSVYTYTALESSGPEVDSSPAS